jgi:hypothetical protein
VNHVSDRDGDVKFSSVSPSRMHTILAVRDTLQLDLGIAQLIAEL